MIEQKVIILAIRHSNELLDDFMVEVKPEYFKDYYASQMYDWLEERYKNNKSVGLASMISSLDLPEEVIEHDLMLKSEFESYLEELKNNHAKRQIKQAVNELNDLVSENTKTADEFRNQAQEIVFNYTQKDEGKQKLIDLDEALSEAFDSLVKQDEGEVGQGLATGFPSLDSKIGGLEPGHVTVLAGQTSMGKTAFSLNLTYNFLKQDKKGLFISLEMSAKEIADRLIIMDSKVDASKYQRKLDASDWNNINAALSRLSGSPLKISEKRGLRVSDIRARAMMETRQSDIDFIIIDYLQEINKKRQSGKNFAQVIGDCVSSIRAIAGDLKVPIILLSQLNRNVNGRPGIGNMRNSGEIEEVADEVWMLWRPEYKEERKKKDQSLRQEAELILGKGRTKGIGTIPLIWYPKFQIFRDKVVENNEGSLFQKHGIEVV